MEHEEDKFEKDLGEQELPCQFEGSDACELCRRLKKICPNILAAITADSG